MQTRKPKSPSHHRKSNTTKVRSLTKRNTTLSVPWEPLLPTLLSLLCTALNDRIKSDWRDNVSTLLNACSVLCKESNVTLHQHALAKYILFYEMWRLRSKQVDSFTSYFLQSWPSFVPLDGPFKGTAVSDANAVRRLDVRSAVADRKSCISTLEMHETKLHVVKSRFYAPDLPPDVPLSIKIFVGRARFMFYAIESEYTDNDPSSFSRCRVCKRKCFFKYQASDESDDDDQCDQEEHFITHPPLGSIQSQREYWKLCGGRQPYLEHNVSQCCCGKCRDVLQTEIHIAMGITSLELLEFDAPHKKEGTGKVPAALRAALKRNEIAARRMRATENHSYQLLSTKEATHLRSMATTMMNVDLALLNAAAYLVECPALMCGRVIPPLTKDWRSVPTLCRSAVVACRQFYNAYKPPEPKPTSSILVSPKFLSKSRDLAHTFF